MNSPLKLLVLIMLTLPHISRAEPEDQETPPSAELLEFLGEWETVDGQWIDPAEFEDEDFAELLRVTDDE